jgi:hypothetical protein
VQKGKLTKQVVGRNKIGSYPKKIAVTLGLHNSVEYTGRYRRSGATLVSNAGLSVLQLKESGGWSSSTVAEAYVAESVANKRTISGAFGADAYANYKTSPPSEQSPQSEYGIASGPPIVYNLCINVAQSDCTGSTLNLVIPKELKLLAVGIELLKMC